MTRGALALAVLVAASIGCSSSQGDRPHVEPHDVARQGSRSPGEPPVASASAAREVGERDPGAGGAPRSPRAEPAPEATGDPSGSPAERAPDDELGVHGDAPATDPPGMPAVRAAHPEWRSAAESPSARMEEAERERSSVVHALFGAAGVAFPPRQLLLRVFKREGRVELWAAGEARGALTHVTTYEVCYASGHLGPKRKQGDLQVPEGFYVASYLNPASRYHLSMLVSYPNASDRILGDLVDPGNEIMVHGRCVSIGCVSLSDERIEEIWLAVKPLTDAGGKAHIHIFPSRDIPALIRAGVRPEHHGFWQNLDEGKARFERDHLLVTPGVDRSGRYLFR